jgi:hypothetical protein
MRVNLLLTAQFIELLHLNSTNDAQFSCKRMRFLFPLNSIAQSINHQPIVMMLQWLPLIPVVAGLTLSSAWKGQSDWPSRTPQTVDRTIAAKVCFCARSIQLSQVC